MTEKVEAIFPVEWTGCYSEAIITVQSRAWFGLGRVIVRRYRGAVTVWHDADTGRRADSGTEAWLCDVWIKARWERKEAARDA